MTTPPAPRVDRVELTGAAEAVADRALARALSAALTGVPAAAAAHLHVYFTLAEAAAAPPAMAARARRVLRRLGRLPRGHVVPPAVATAEEFLAVLAANQDSPQRELTGGVPVLLDDGPGGGRAGGPRLILGLRLAAVLNHGVEREGKPHPDRENPFCRWEVSEFVTLAWGETMAPATPHQARALALAGAAAYAALRAAAEAARPLGFEWVDRRDVARWARRLYGGVADPVPGDVFADSL